jgi:hypothetical protein
MDYNQAMQQIQAMQMYRRMLGLDQAQGGGGRPQSQMQYVGMNQGVGQQQQKQSSNPMSTYNNVMKMFPASTATGMTPNATNPSGESFYGWGSQTGDWGATASPAMYDATTSASSLGVPTTGSELTALSGGMGGEAAGIGGAEGGGMLAGAGPYAALAAAIGGFKLNSDWMAGGKDNSGWFKTMWDEGFNEMFGTEGWYGVIKNLF